VPLSRAPPRRLLSRALSSQTSVVRGRDVLTAEGLRPASIHIVDGVIAAVAGFDEVPAGAPLHDLGPGEVLLPGFVDAHVHINEPGRTLWEGFATATRAAAAGGVTTLVDMPLNSIPPTTTVEHLHAKVAAAEGQLWVDVGLWGGAIPGNADELGRLLDAGALGFKCFMVDSGVDEFPMVREPDLRAALAVLRERGAPLLVHAELPGPIEAALQRAGGFGDPRSYAAYVRSRPRDAEDQAVALLARLMRDLPARVHVVHLSSSGALPVLRAARREGLALSAETTPHYLSLCAEDVPDGATAYKCAPPIRERENRDALWGALSDGLIEMVVSDHSPCTPELKRMTEGSFEDAWGGIASLQLGPAIVWTEARARGHRIEELSRWMSEAPAALAGLTRRKGRIAKGLDADLVSFRPDVEFTVDASALQHRHKVTPYAGRRLFGQAAATFVRGRVVHDERGLAAAPTGRWVKREGT
jgi:allantoinase